MDELKENYSRDGFLHHAYLIEGERGDALQKVKDFLEGTLKIKTIGNPDVIIQEFETLSIDDARGLKDMASRKSFSGGKKIFVLSANFFTREAENSLLKLFEEPALDTHFFIITPERERVAPTLLSRMSLVELTSISIGNSEIKALASKLLKLSPSERIRDEKVKNLIEEKEKAKVIALIDQFIKIIHEKNKVTKENKEIFEDLIKAKSYLGDRAPSIKIILEYVLLII